MEGAIERRFANGRSQRIEYVAEYDRVYPVSGTEAYDHILLKRIDERTAQAVLSHAGRVYGVARRVIAPSGASMTITLNRESSTGPNGVEYGGVREGDPVGFRLPAPGYRLPNDQRLTTND